MKHSKRFSLSKILVNYHKQLLGAIQGNVKWLSNGFGKRVLTEENDFNISGIWVLLKFQRCGNNDSNKTTTITII